MKAFSILALTAGLVAAAPTPKEQHLEKRVLDPVSAGIISGAIVTAVVGTASGVAAGSINNILPNLNTWEQVREEFTKKTVEEMWARRPDDNVAAICYVSDRLTLQLCKVANKLTFSVEQNMDYTVSKPDQVSELASVKLSSGLLNTDYDCFFLKG